MDGGEAARHPAVGRAGTSGTEAIHCGQVIRNLRPGQRGIQQHHRIIQGLGSADFPMKPVVILRRVCGVDICIHPIQTAGHGIGEICVALPGTPGRRPRQRHGLQPVVSGNDVRGHGAERQVAP